jgi:hypothetical protein
MLLIVIILLVSFILIPLLELTLKDYVLLVAKVLVFAATLLYVIWMLFAVGHHAILT